MQHQPHSYQTQASQKSMSTCFRKFSTYDVNLHRPCSKKTTSFVLLCITGSRDINFSLSEDGMKLIVDYVWPSVLLSPYELFKDVLLDNWQPLPISHPKVYAYQNRLSDCDLSMKSYPEASLVISLPLRVQRELGTFKKQGLTCGDTKLVMLQFTA